VTTSDPRLKLAPSQKPCGECPFRRASMPGWLGSNAPADFIVAITTEQPLPCHSSIDYDDSEWRDKFMAGEEGRLCAGALIMSANMCKRPRDPTFPQRPADRELVFANHLEFMAHHENAAVRSWETDDSYEIRESSKRPQKRVRARAGKK
jgi:hypothetical protein